MPRILINEVDLTSPGSPSSYSNYAVLIPGFMARTPILTADAEEYNTLHAAEIKADPKKEMIPDEVQPDANGVYEFTSQQDFRDTIGVVKPFVTGEVEENNIELYHYGNQMAYALLGLGYTVIYKPLKNIAEIADTDTGMCSENFWEIFKDKSNYDFRFVVHGLLESHSNIPKSNYVLQERLDAVNAAITKLNEIKTAAGIAEGATTITADQIYYVETAYAELSTDAFPGLIDTATGEAYPKYGISAMFNEDENDDKENSAIFRLIEEKNYLESLNLSEEPKGTVTTAVINEVNKQIAALAEYNNDDREKKDILGRGDCTALIELDEKTYTTVSHQKP